MFSSVNRRKIGLYEKAIPHELSWDEKLKITKELGFDFLEISVDESDDKLARLDWDDKTIYALRSKCEKFGVPLHSMCLSAHRRYPFGSANDDTRQQAMKIMHKAISLAYKLGVRTIQLAGYDVYYEESTELSHQRFVRGMIRSAKAAERAGVMLAVEIMDTEYLNSLGKFEILSREINSPYFCAYPDVGNITGWNYEICTELALSAPKIVQIHLKDAFRARHGKDGQFRDLIIGEGDVNFSAIMTTLKKMNCVVPFVLEMWANDDNWYRNIEIAKSNLNRACEKEKLPNLF